MNRLFTIVLLVNIIFTPLLAPRTTATTRDDSTAPVHAPQAQIESNNSPRQFAQAALASPNTVPTIANPDIATDVAAGGQHTCAVANGNVWCWGDNRSGQLGDGTTIKRITPVYVRTADGQPLAQVTKIVAGDSHTCALVNTAVWCWGGNSVGQLGNGGSSNSAYAVPVTLQDGTALTGASTLASKYNYSCVAKNSNVWCWGQTRQYAAQMFSTTLTGLTSIGVGWNSSCAAINGLVRCWGNSQATLLTPSSTSDVMYSDGYFQRGLTGVTTVDVGNNHTCAQSDVGLVCWGSNSQGQLGRPINIDCCWSTYAKKVMLHPATGNSGSGANILSLSMDFSCGLAVTIVVCWGVNSSGQLGNGQRRYNDDDTYNNAYFPVYPLKNVTTSLNNVTAISAGQRHACAVDAGKVWCWGSDSYNQVGDGSNNFQSYAVEIPLYKADVLNQTTQVVSGSGHTCAIIATQVWCWGVNGDGLLGTGLMGNQSLPKAVLDNDGSVLQNVSKISAGAGITCVVQLGKVKCWGSSGANLRGFGGNPVSSIPEYVYLSDGSILDNIDDIDVNQSSACVVRLGHVLCWGDNTFGQLGNSTINTSRIPIDVIKSNGLPLTGVTDVAISASHACAVTADSVWCWGDNTYGQLGNGSVINSRVAVQATKLGGGALNGAISVDVDAYSHSCAELPSSIWCWGSNRYGQLGDSTTTSRLAAVQVTRTWNIANDGTLHLSIGGNKSCILANGVPYCWGYAIRIESYNWTNYTTPVKQTTDENAPLYLLSTLSVSSTHSCAIKQFDVNQIWCWGYNGEGALGIGNFTNKSYGVQAVLPSATDIQNRITTITPSPTLTPTVTQLIAASSTTTPSRTPTINVPAPVVANPDIATDVAAGGQHTCAVANGNVWCWGDNSSGQLGDGTTVKRITPVYVRTADGHPLAQVTKIVAGDSHTCALVNTAVWCWGGNSVGQLGNGGSSNSAYAVPVTLQDGTALTGASKLASKYNYSCVAKNSNVWCWGQTRQYAAQMFSTTLTGLTSIGVGWNSSCAAINGLVRCWGNSQATLLTPSSTSDVMYSDGYFQRGLTGVTTVDVGNNHTCAQSDVGLVCWGSNSQGQLGRPDCCGSTYAKKVMIHPATGNSGSGANILSLSMDFSCGLAGTSVTCWGVNSSGQLGNGQRRYNDDDTYNKADFPVYPLKNPTTGLNNVRAISTGQRHTCAVDAGKVWCWGASWSGQLADESQANQLYAVEIPLYKSTQIDQPDTAVAGSRICSLVAGVIWCWGDNWNGILRNGTTTNQSAPKPALDVNGVPFTDVSKIIVADGICFEKSNHIYCWGADNAYQNGFGTPNNSIVPAEVKKENGDSFQKIDQLRGSRHVCVLENGSVWCWGDNSNGQLGNGTATRSAVAVRVLRSDGTPLTGVTAIDAGDTHTCAASTDTVWCWGANNVGQLGDGTTTQNNYATQATKLSGGALSGVTAIGLGSSHSCVLIDGNGWCWGGNWYGQLGDGTTTNRLAAVTVNGLSGATLLDAGGQVSCALVGGVPYCWGLYQAGIVNYNLANATSATMQRQDDGAPLYRYTSISVGTSSQCGIRAMTNREVWCKGQYNSDGQLGDGTTLQRNGAVKVAFNTASGSINTTITPPATNTPTPTQTYTPTNTATASNTPTNTAKSSNTPTNTPTNTATSSNTPTNTATASNTPTDTATPSNTPTDTATASNTPTNTATSSNTPTDTVTASNTPTNTATASNTPTNTATSSNTPTDTATPSDTSTYTATPSNTPTNTATPSNTPTNTATATNTPTDTATPSNTPTDTATASNTPTDTATPSNTPTDTATSSNTPTNTATPSDTPTYTATASNTPTNTATASNTPTNTATASNTPTDTATSSNTLTNTVTSSNTPTNTATPSNTPTNTATASNTPTNTATASNTPTNTATASNTPTNTATPSNTPTDTATSSNTPTDTATASNTPTDTATASNTPTDTATASNTPTDTATLTNTQTRTSTVTRSRTVTLSYTRTYTRRPLPKASATAIIVPTAIPANTVVPTIVPTNTIIKTVVSTIRSTMVPAKTVVSTKRSTVVPAKTATLKKTGTSVKVTLSVERFSTRTQTMIKTPTMYRPVTMTKVRPSFNQ